MNKKIAFLGTPKISADFLDDVINAGLKISCVITSIDKIRSRNNKVLESDVALVAKKHNIDVYKPLKLNNDYEFLKKIKPDLILTFAYGQILSCDVLKLSKYKPLNIHASLLPTYRGASPIQSAIKNGDKKTGISIIEMVKEMDKGDIYFQKEIEIDNLDNYTTLSNKISKVASKIIIPFLNDYFNLKIKPIKQNDNIASYCHLISKNDYKLSLDEEINTIINHVRYLANKPGAYFNLDSSIIKIYEIENYSSEVIKKPGTLFIDNKKLLLQLNKGIIKINKLQLPGKNVITSSDYINGNNNKKEIILN